MKSKFDQSFIKELFLLLFVGFLINLFCVFLFFIPSHASSVNSTQLPFHQSYISTYQDYFSNYSDSLDIVLNYYGVENYDNCAIIVLEGSDSSTNYRFKTIFLNDDNFYHLSPYNASYQSINLIDFTDFTSDYFIYDGSISAKEWKISKSNLSNFSSGSSTLSSLSNVSILGNHNSVSFGVTFCYPIYIKGTLTLNPVGYVNEVLVFTDNVIPGNIGYGHATEPDPFDNPQLSSGSNHTLPHEVPESPIINNYTWITYNPPSIDATNLESLVESFIYVVNYLAGWFKDNIAGEFQNLIFNLVVLVEYIVLTIQYYQGLIIDNIQNAITTFYNNMVSLFEVISENINAISEPAPIDSQAVNDAISDTSFNGLITAGIALHDEFSDFFDSIEEVNTLRFTVPYTILTQSGFVVIDFSWYDDIKDSVLPWIIGFLYAGFGLALFRSIPSIIHGVSGILQKGG